MAHGVTQGALSAAQGGDFAAGFFSGAFASVAGSVMGETNWGKATFQFRHNRVIAAAIVGGTASKLAGGKFANGAVTAAMVQLFNAETQVDAEAETESRELSVDELKNMPEEIKRRLRNSLGETLFGEKTREFGGIVEGDGEGNYRNYPADKPFIGSKSRLIIKQRGILGRLINRLTGWDAVFNWHTHPRGSPPSWPNDYPTKRSPYPAVVLTRETIFIVNPGAWQGEYLTVPTTDVLPKFNPRPWR